MSESGLANNRRLFTRVSYTQTANIRYGGGVWSCKMIDLSLNGAMFEAPPGLSLEAAAQFTIELPGVADAPLLAQAEVVHVGGTQVGCRFNEIDTHSMDGLRELMLALSSEEDLPQ